MLRKTIFAAIATFLITDAWAMPLGNIVFKPVSEMQRVKIVCEETGLCYRPNTRKPVVRWVYGDNVFYRPYVGPRNYGRPGYHSGWSFFGLW